MLALGDILALALAFWLGHALSTFISEDLFSRQFMNFSAINKRFWLWKRFGFRKSNGS